MSSAETVGQAGESTSAAIGAFEQGEQLAVMAAHMDAAKHRFLVALREFEATGNWFKQGFRSCAQWMSWRIGMDIHTSREYVRVAKALPKMPLIEEALRTATVSYSKVRAMTRVATPQNEEVLLEQARLATASQLAAICRKYGTVVRAAKDNDPKLDAERRRVSRRDLSDGMVEVRAVLFAEEAELVWTAINQMATELCRRSKGDSAASTSRMDTLSSGSEPSPTSASSSLGRESSTDPSSSNAPASRMSSKASEASSKPVSNACDSRASADAWSPRASTSDASASGTSTSTPDPSTRLFSKACESGRTVDASLSNEHAVSAVASQANKPVESPSPASSSTLDDSDDALARAWAWSPRTDPTYLTVPESLYEDDGIDDTPTVVTLDLRTLSATAPTREQRRTERRNAFDRASALVAIAELFVRGRAGERSPSEVLLTVPIAALRGVTDVQNVSSFASGASVPAETVRRICCDTGLVPMLEDGDGRPIAIGQKSRTISGAAKRALLNRDKTCTFPGCATRVFLEGHHATHWADGGKTSLDNMCAVCSYHHRFVHEYGYSVEVVEGAAVFRDPKGEVVPAAPKPAQPERLGWPTLEELDADLDITSESYGPGYDGCRFSYHLAVRALVLADDL